MNFVKRSGSHNSQLVPVTELKDCISDAQSGDILTESWYVPSIVLGTVASSQP